MLCPAFSFCGRVDKPVRSVEAVTANQDEREDVRVFGVKAHVVLRRAETTLNAQRFELAGNLGFWQDVLYAGAPLDKFWLAIYFDTELRAECDIPVEVDAGDAGGERYGFARLVGIGAELVVEGFELGDVGGTNDRGGAAVLFSDEVGVEVEAVAALRGKTREIHIAPCFTCGGLQRRRGILDFAGRAEAGFFAGVTSDFESDGA